MSEPTESSDVNSKEANIKLKDFGYDMYPERRGKRYSPSTSEILFHGKGKEFTEKFKCEKNVYACVQKSKLIYLYHDVTFIYFIIILFYKELIK